jgi:protein phosphatase
MEQKLRLLAAAKTDPGQVHSVNQDSAFAYVREPTLGKTRGLFIVADGMGGHQAGEVASRLAVETISKELDFLLQQSDLDETTPSPPPEAGESPSQGRLELFTKRLQIAIEGANEAISQYGQSDPVAAGNLGTTLTCVLVDDNQAIIANIGDSRTYLLRDQQFKQITEDHSYVAHLVREGQLAPEEIFVHPRRNVITRSLGYQPEVIADFWSMFLQPGDRLLLCSDGLWEMVQDEAVIANHIATARHPAQSVESLVAAANAGGGADNIGVVIVHVEDSVPADSLADQPTVRLSRPE